MEGNPVWAGNLLDWPKSSFGLFIRCYEKTQMNFLANPKGDGWRRIPFFTRSEDFIQLTDTFLLPLSLTRPPVLRSGPSSVLSIPAGPGQRLEDGKGTE